MFHPDARPAAGGQIETMNEVEEAKMRHPASGGSVALLELPRRTPGQAFVGALEDLRLAIELYGPGSPQALFAHRAVDAARQRAVETSQDDPSAA